MLLKNLDLHLHSFFSDGTMSLKHILLEAFDLNYSSIALTDHFDQINERNKLENYVEELTKAKKSINNSLNFFSAIEVPYAVFNDFKSKFGFLENKLDFFLVEDVEDFPALYDVIDYSAITTLPCGLAHLATHQFNDKQKLVDLIGNSNVFLELNQGYFNRKYTEKAVKQEQLNVFALFVKEYSNLFSVGTDSHGIDSLMSINTKNMLDFLASKNVLTRLLFLEQIIAKDKGPVNKVFSENPVLSQELSFNDIENSFSDSFKKYSKNYISLEEKVCWVIPRLFPVYDKIPKKLKNTLASFDSKSLGWKNFSVWQLGLLYKTKNTLFNKKIFDVAVNLFNADSSGFLGYSIGSALLFSAVSRNVSFKVQANEYVNKLKAKKDSSLQKNLERLQKRQII